MPNLRQGRPSPLPRLRLTHLLPWATRPLSGPGTPAWPIFPFSRFRS